MLLLLGGSCTSRNRPPGSGSIKQVGLLLRLPPPPMLRCVLLQPRRPRGSHSRRSSLRISR